MKLDITIVHHDGYTELQVGGTPIHEDDFTELHEIVEAEHEKGIFNIILNMGDVDIINSLGINALIKIMTKCRNAGGDLYIVNISEKINQVLLLTKLNTVLNIAPSVDAAAAEIIK